MNNDQFKKLVQNSRVVNLDVGCGPHKKVGYIGFNPILNSFANNFLSLYERFFSRFIKAWRYNLF